MRKVGVTSRGIRLPILKQGDNLANEVVKNVIEASENEGFKFHDKDIVAVTESILARCQGNYCSIENIAEDVKNKTGGETVGIVFPILSRNRFSILLKGIAMGCQKLIIQLSYPRDEVGNALFSDEKLYKSQVNPYSTVLNLEQYRNYFGYEKHEFTGVDYVEFYQELVNSVGCECEVIFANNPTAILEFSDVVIACDIHTRKRTKELLKENGAKIVLGLDDLMTSPVHGSGCNEKYGLLGSNKSTENIVKLFPRDGMPFVLDVQKQLFEKTGKHFEVMVYGDGAFKDPQGKIWELADPVVSPFFTDGLTGTPNELKLKFLADNDLKDLSGQELATEMKAKIKEKESNLVGKMASQGTTPRQLTDLLGSLSDLTSGSGDKGTPVILIQGYFDNYATD